MKISEIVDGVLKGDRQSIARAISYIENEQSSAEAREIIHRIFPHTGKAHVIGITGPPGIGKSTMIGTLSRMLSDRGHKLAVIAVDASSPFSGGSLLGNRIRMQESLTKHGVYMRSIANRGMNGGLSRSTWDTVKILDAAGNEFIIIETVGAGQADLDIVHLADTVSVILGPGLGDQIQAIKAGMMEIGEIFVINKIDKDGAYLAIKDIEESVSFSRQGEWKVPVVGTNSLTGEGYDEYIDCIMKHRDFVRKHGNTRIRRFRNELRMAVEDEIMRRFSSTVSQKLSDDRKIEDYYAGSVDPYSAAGKIVDEILAGM